MRCPSEPIPADEHALMCRYHRSGDGVHMDALVASLAPRALVVAERLTGDRALAEDALQEALLRVVRHRERFDPNKSFHPWFYAILRHVCADLRRRRRRDRLRLDGEAPGPAPASQPDQAEGWADARDLLGQLPASHADALVLRIYGGMSFAEVAAALGIGSEAAKKRAQRGLRKLRDLLEAAETPRSSRARPDAGRAILAPHVPSAGPVT
jgi:RNA polymerase sigma-70 factor (ECF subfamily)